MMISRSYRIALCCALVAHALLLMLLLKDSTTQNPVLTMEAKNEAGQSQPLPVEPQDQAIKAVSVDSQEVMDTINHLKEERVKQQRAEESRQQALTKQLELAKKQRIEEQNHLAKLKEEEEKLAVSRKKQMAEEQKHLQQLAAQKAQEEKRLEEMKKQQAQLKKQQQEAEKQAELSKRKAEQLAKENKEREVKAKEQGIAQKKAAAAQQAAAAQSAESQARLAGEVDKYKALIINAISSRWILPENTADGLSSQFRIRLAPNGVVLSVALARSSGNPILDRSAQTAIYKASPLPVPADSETFELFREISLTVRPENVRG